MQEIITPLGDSAITIVFGDSLDELINQRVYSVFYHLQKQNFDCIKDIIPGYASLSIIYDVVKARRMGKTNAYNFMYELIETALQESTDSVYTGNRTIQIPVCYDVSLGTDLIEMSRQKKLSLDEVVQLHSSVKYRVYMLGFLPGFAYMGTVNDKIATPRKATPDKQVRAGSVGIADAQTGIYSLDSPGGWNIIGQTPVKIFNAYKEHPCLLQPGDEVKFEPISLDQFFQLKK